MRLYFCLAIGTFHKFFGLEFEKNPGAIAPGLGVALSGYWHKFILLVALLSINITYH
jgi:hypothetical protein